MMSSLLRVVGVGGNFVYKNTRSDEFRVTCLTSFGVDVALAEELLDYRHVLLLLHSWERSQHDGGVARLVLLIHAAHTCDGYTLVPQISLERVLLANTRIHQTEGRVTPSLPTICTLSMYVTLISHDTCVINAIHTQVFLVFVICLEYFNLQGTNLNWSTFIWS